MRAGHPPALPLHPLRVAARRAYRFIKRGVLEPVTIDLDGVYNPCRPNDRLLLGMKGSISEFELGVLRARMLDAARSKARRGELRISVPIGFIWHREIGLGLDPDARVQEATRLVFSRFRQLGSARQVHLSLKAEGVHFPRPSDGKKMTSFEWTPIRYRNVISVLKNPFYAGAYAYGKSEHRTEIVDGRARKTYGHHRPLQDCEILLKEHHEGYIDWAEFERNQKQLAANAYRRPNGAKSGRGGRALLVGLLVCRRCGRRLTVNYTSHSSRHACQPVYRCDRGAVMLGQRRCMMFGGLRVDMAVVQELVRAVEPMAIEAALAAERKLMERQAEQRRIVELELQQARYEASLAERRYAACDPDNRLIAATLEKSWEAALRRVQDCETRLDATTKAIAATPAPDLVGLAEDLGAAWKAAGVTMRTRQQLLLDICGLRDCLIADRDGVYDPSSANGRLLLGLKGTISELELHTIRSRLTAGLLAKAERGDLALNLPVGLSRDPSGLVVKDPDIEVQGRLELVFQTFLKYRTVAKVMRVLNQRSLDLPRRDRHGDLRWAKATLAAVSKILQNPAYAGAFAYGRTRMRKTAREAATPAKTPRPIGEWRFIVKDRYPAYIDWATYERIRQTVRDNRAEYMRIKSRGAPRDGDLLLHGIAWCARCGHKMYVRYKGGGEYVCNHLRSHEGLPGCQSLRAARIDGAVADAFLAALAPAELDALARARRTQNQVDAALRSGVEHQLERKRYAAALAERQFSRVDPDNRLVAGELERRWEAALLEVREAEEALARQTAPKPVAHLGMSKELTGKVVALTGRLPLIWADEATSDGQRKTLLRCLVEKVVLDRGDRDIASIRIVWRGGAVSELEVKMKVNAVSHLTRGAEMRERVLQMAGAGVPDDEISTALTADGHRSPDCTEKVLPITVQRIRLGAGMKVIKQRTRWAHPPEVITANALAAKLGIPVNWLYVQIRAGRLLLDRQSTGAHLFPDTPEAIDAVRQLRAHTSELVDLRINQPHQEGHQHA